MSKGCPAAPVLLAMGLNPLTEVPRLADIEKLLNISTTSIKSFSFPQQFQVLLLVQAPSDLSANVTSFASSLLSENEMLWKQL